MRLSDILVCLDATPAGAERLNAATRLARATAAQIFGVYAQHDETVEAMLFPETPETNGGRRFDAFGVGNVAALRQLSPSARAEVAAKRFRDMLATHGIRGSWHLLDGASVAELVELAKFSDLAILGQFVRNGHSRIALRPEEVTLGCGRPVLIMPYAGRFATIGMRVLIAWDATREAARALHDALPLIEDAEAVTVLTVVNSDTQRDPALLSLERVVRHLGRHGITARAETTVRGDLSIADVLLSRGADLGADLIVAGAYHHSPYREALFGGVTRDLLDHMTVPVLMSH